jgi:hypothetical protein
MLGVDMRSRTQSEIFVCDKHYVLLRRELPWFLLNIQRCEMASLCAKPRNNSRDGMVTR